MKRLCIYILCPVAMLLFISNTSAYIPPFPAASINKIADHAAYKLDKNLVHKLNRSLPIMKTSLVDIDNMEQTSTFGRYLGDQIGDDFSQYGYKVIETKLRKSSLAMKKKRGEFILSRDTQKVAKNNQVQAVISGTYCQGSRYVYISVKIISTQDRSVLSSCDLKVRKYPTIRRLIKTDNYSDKSPSEKELGPFASGKLKLDKNSSKDTKIIQRQLFELDYYHGNIDGIWGPKTQNALEDFKKDYNLAHPEKWSLRTQKKLF